jgi:hypothetical protein
MSDAMRLTHAEADELAGLYVLDALEAHEMDAVRQHLATCSESHSAFAELGGVVPALFETIEPLDAPAELRGRVLAAVADVQQLPALEAATEPVAMRTAPGAHAATRMSAPTSSRAGQPDAPIAISAARERRMGRSPWQVALAAAAVLLIAVLGGWNLLLQDRAGTAENRVAILRDAIAASTDPSSQVALLRGSGSAAGASGLAVFPSGRPGTIVIEGLSPAPGGRTYQAWFLANGTPVSAGLMSVGSDGLAVLSGLSPVSGTDTIALTDEVAGGVAQPTGKPIVAGQVTHPSANAAQVIARVRAVVPKDAIVSVPG